MTPNGDALAGRVDLDQGTGTLDGSGSSLRRHAADVGANVGMYTVFAAPTRGARVFAFEPEAQNYAMLNRNIF